MLKLKIVKLRALKALCKYGNNAIYSHAESLHQLFLPFLLSTESRDFAAIIVTHSDSRSSIQPENLRNHKLLCGTIPASSRSQLPPLHIFGAILWLIMSFMGIRLFLPSIGLKKSRMPLKMFYMVLFLPFSAHIPHA